MSIAAISALIPPAALDTQIAAATTPIAGSGFDRLVDALQTLNTHMQSDQSAVQSLALGQSDDLHRVVMSLESTKMEFDLALQVRNKVLDAYQELMRMQI